MTSAGPKGVSVHEKRVQYRPRTPFSRQLPLIYPSEGFKKPSNTTECRSFERNFGHMTGKLPCSSAEKAFETPKEFF